MANSIDGLEALQETLLGRIPFSVMARVAMQLGRESISSSIIAIIELIKNAYDADAENISIRFADAKTNDPVLVIEDDGYGMTRQQLEQQWLVIGTPNKLASSRSKDKGRVLTGEKGLGRLGLDRLCTRTTVYTFVANQGEGTKLLIDWSKYENIDERLEEVKHDLYAVPKVILDPVTSEFRDIFHGTVLVLAGLKDSWSHEFMLRLREELTLLVSPFAGVGDFSVSIDSGMGWSDIDGRIGSDVVLDVAEWNVVAELDYQGLVTIVMSSEHFEQAYRFGPTSWTDSFKTLNQEIPECGPLKFQMYFYPRREVNSGDLSFSRAQISRFLDANNGIRIYRDGFRVRPYGDPDGNGDWLRLSYRRQQNPQGVTQPPIGSWRVGYNQVVGAVFISRENNRSLIDQTNRENLVEGLAFSDMRMFVEKAIQFFEVKRQEFEIARREPESSSFEKAKDEVERSSSETEQAVIRAKDIVASVIQSTSEGTIPAPETINSLDQTLTKLEDQLEQVRQAQKEFVRQAEEQQALLQKQKDTLGNLASLGILATSFGHETIGASNLVLLNATNLSQDLSAGLFMVDPNIREEIDEELGIILHEADKIETFARFMLRNVRRDARNRHRVFLNQVVQRVFGYFSKILDEKNVSVILDIPTQISPILAFEIDWESIFVNLIANSVWALENIPAKAKTIRVILREHEKQISVSFGDSGKGIEKGTEDQIFLPTISTKRNEQGHIVGTGMGLAIVKDFVESHTGAGITVESPCDLGGAQFNIRVQVPELSSQRPRLDDNAKKGMAN